MTTTKHAYQLGQRVRFKAYMQRRAGHTGDQWRRWELSGKGVIVGKRTCSDGYTTWEGDCNLYHPTKRHSFWLVAYSLAGCRYVAEGDLEAME